MSESDERPSIVTMLLEERRYPPADAFAACAAGAESLTGIGIAVTLARHRRSLGILIRTLRKAGVTAPIVVGGAGVTAMPALTLGVDHWAQNVDDAVRLLATP